MRSALYPFLLLAAAGAAQAQPASTFQLPPDPEATTRPQAQGPVDVEGETRSVPRVIGEPTPQPTATQPAPRPTAAPTATASPTSSPRPTTDAPGPSLPATDSPVSRDEILAEPSPRSAPDDGTTEPEPAPESSATQNTPPPALPDLPGTFTDEPAPDLTGGEPGILPSSWWMALLAGLIGLGAIGFALLRRRATAGSQAPQPVDLSGPPLREVTTHSYLAQPDARSLEVEAFAVTLSRSVMNASISYRVSLINRGREPIALVKLHGDVTTAHGRVPAEQQLADPAQDLPELHALDRLDPGQRATLNGELRLPLREVRALRQGSVPVFVPLLRLIVRADRLEPRAFTYVIGTRGAQKGARPNPFRLDEPPRSYAQLTTRAVA